MPLPRSNRVFNAPFLGALLLSLALSGCIQSRWEKPPQSQPEAAPAASQRGTPGNPPFYEVFGRRYHVMEASTGYQERGVASWYGKKFHGRRTSNGEIYNMHAMTAAHKTLPLPTRVRVTNLKNGRSVILRVNDRGPFVDNRIIDLSYSAATELDMIQTGTAMVEVAALPVYDAVPTAMAEAPQEPAPERRTSTNVYLQVGAFGDRGNAQQLMARLTASGLENVAIHFDAGESPALHRVRLGPIGDVSEYDSLLQRVAALQIHDTQLITENSTMDVITPEQSGI